MDRTELSLLSLILSTTALVALATPARAGDIFVPGDHATIQQAIAASVDGDTIHVAAGTWQGAISFLDRDITLRGAGSSLTILDGQGAAQTVLGGIGSTVVTVTEVTITGGQVGVATTADGRVYVQQCTIRDNAGIGATGKIQASGCEILDNGGSGLSPFELASNCRFKGNGAWGAEDLTGKLHVGVSSCSFLGNWLGGAHLTSSGGTFSEKSSTTVSYCIFSGDTLVVESGNPSFFAENRIAFSTFDGSPIIAQGGLLKMNLVVARGPAALVTSGTIDAWYSDVEGMTSAPWKFCVDADPLWTNPAAGDYSLQPGSPCINAGDPALPFDLDKSPHDMGALSYYPWTDLGGGLAGSTGLATLTGVGPLIAGKWMAIELLSAKPNTPAWLVLGFAQLGTPFKGGTLWPAPSVVAGPFPTSFAGNLPLGAWWPSDLPAGFTFISQIWWADAGAPHGWAASNGVRGVQP